MKRYLIFVIIAFVCLYSASCTKENTTGNFPPLKVAIPEVLKNNDEVTDYIKSATKSINDWSEKIEQLSGECQVYADKKESEMSFSEKQKLGKSMIDYMAGMGQFAVQMADIENEGVNLLSQLSGDENAALNQVIDQYHQRIASINKYYENLNQEEE